MEINLVILVLGVICGIGYGNASIVDGTFESGMVISSYRSIMSRADGQIDACTKKGQKCSADCKTLIICDSPTDDGTRVLCSTINPAIPICDKNTNQCAASLSTAGCEPPKETYKCFTDGVYPDPRDCKRYYLCIGGTVTVKTCPEYSTYYGGVEACVSLREEDGTYNTTALICSEPLVCGTTQPSYAVYKPSPAYYMLCIGSDSYMMKCDDVANEYFDTESNKCVYSCSEAGAFPDITNKGFFWYCTNRGAIGVKNACPVTYEFNAINSKCLPSHQ